LYDIKAGNNGRTGKTIIGDAVGHIRNVARIDGKQVDFRNNRFALQKVTPWTEVVLIDDLARGMSLGPLFNMITGDSDAEKKGKDPITIPLKYMMTSNWVMELEGTSEQGRQFITQIEDFYIQYSKLNKDCLQPIVHLHGKEFFTDWDEKDWSKFDSFAVRCLQSYLGDTAPENTIMGNAMQIRFLQQHEKELFYELSSTFVSKVTKSKDGHLLIVSRILSNVVKESTNIEGIQKSGKLVREFLFAVGAGPVTLTSVAISGIPQMAYKIEKKFDDLDFGEIGNSLPKPRF
jgi:hypothetical protein